MQIVKTCCHEDGAKVGGDIDQVSICIDSLQSWRKTDPMHHAPADTAISINRFDDDLNLCFL